jgi:hypothetical protein
MELAAALGVLAAAVTVALAVAALTIALARYLDRH